MTTTSPGSPATLARTAGPAASPHDTAWRRVGRSIWQALEGLGEARARAELERLAAVHAGVDPELSARLRESARQLR